MRRVIVIGAGCEGLSGALAALGMQVVDTVEKFRELAELMPRAEVPTLAAPPAPQFGSARPYLKKKKGRA